MSGFSELSENPTSVPLTRINKLDTQCRECRVFLEVESAGEIEPNFPENDGVA
jgi:hypothetical protein